jgi:hypothetical protein
MLEKKEAWDMQGICEKERKGMHGGLISLQKSLSNLTFMKFYNLRLYVMLTCWKILMWINN